MTEHLTIQPNETGLVRVFFLTRPADMPRGQTLTPDQIATWLGADALNVVDVQHIWTDDLTDDLGLPELLTQGYDIDPAQIAAQDATLNAVTEMHPTAIVIARSGAFLNRPLTLPQDGPLYLVATFQEPGSAVTFEPLPNPDPEAILEDPTQKKRASDAAMSGRIATVALLVMALLVWLMIWIAG